MRRLLFAALATALCAGCSRTPAQPAAVDHGGSPSILAVTVPLNFMADLEGSSENPPRETNALGRAILQLSADGSELSYTLISSRITNVTASHIHVGAATENGPVVAFLFGTAPSGGGAHNGVLAKGTVTAANLTGPLAGQPLSALVAEMTAGNTYVNVHTNDGVDPTNTGAGDFPGGEIRGQIFQNGGGVD
jgi:hypothetical protein